MAKKLKKKVKRILKSKRVRRAAVNLLDEVASVNRTTGGLPVYRPKKIKF